MMLLMNSNEILEVDLMSAVVLDVKLYVSFYTSNIPPARLAQSVFLRLLLLRSIININLANVAQL